MNMCDLHFILFCFFVIFIIIAIPTYCYGCNPNISNTCIIYSTFSGTIYKKSIVKTTCKSCTNCILYTCYDAYVHAQDLQNNSSCSYQVTKSQRNESYAKLETNKYYNGEYVNWLKEKNTNMCFNINSAFANWIVSIIFFSLAGLLLLIELYYIGYILYLNHIIKKINNLNNNNREFYNNNENI